MKKITLTSMVLLMSILLSACSGPVVSLSGQASDVLRSAANTIEQQAQENQPVAQATPVAPVIPAEASGLLSAYEGTLENVYLRVNPSVVNIRVVQKVDLGSQIGELPQIPGLPFDMPGMPEIPGMPNTPEGPDSQGPQYSQGLGSGFVWDREGHIVTNNHVVSGADKIEITFADGTVAPATLVGADPYSDLAVVKVDLPEGIQPLSIADSEQVRAGQLAIAIGNPYGLEGTMTLGIISAVGRTMPAGERTGNGPTYSIPDVIQTDAPINPGNSGGVLVNDQGEVVGVTFAIESSSGSNAGIGFVIPSAIVKRVVPALIQDGSYTHPYLGISGTGLRPDLAKAMDLEEGRRGVLVAEVTADGPADKAGLRGSDRTIEVDGQEITVGGDVITAINGETIQDMDDLIAYLSNSTEVGQTVSLTILRDGKETTVDVTLEARPGQQPAPAPETTQEAQGKAFLGINAMTLTPEIAQEMDLDAEQKGALVQEVMAGSPADQADLRGSFKPFEIDGEQILIGGDVIIALDDQAVESIEDLVALLKDYQPGQEVELTILRDGKHMTLVVELGERS